MSDQRHHDALMAIALCGGITLENGSTIYFATTRQIARATGWDGRSIGAALRALQNRDLVRKDSNGEWYATTAGEFAAEMIQFASDLAREGSAA